MSNNFSKWFDENSGYALHRTALRKFSIKNCCGSVPVESGKSILFPDPETGKMEPFQLYHCASCGKIFIRRKEGFCLIDNLLKYKILP